MGVVQGAVRTSSDSGLATHHEYAAERLNHLLCMKTVRERFVSLEQILAGTLAPEGPPDPEHLAILLRWHTSSWRDGEWLALDSLERIPYRKIVNAIPPRIVTDAIIRRFESGSASRITPPRAAIGGTLSWITAAEAALKEGSTAYHTT